MSRIPYLERLGAALESSIAERESVAPRPMRPPWRAALVAFAVTLVVGGVWLSAATNVFRSAEPVGGTTVDTIVIGSADEDLQARYWAFQEYEEAILDAVAQQLGDEKSAGIWLTRDTWEVNIGVVGGLPESGLDLPATDRITYVIHDRPESLVDLWARARAEGKSVDVRTGQLREIEDFTRIESDL